MKTSTLMRQVKSKWLQVTLLVLISTGVYAGGSSLSKYNALKTEDAEKYALYAMMSSHAYIDKTKRTYFPVENLGWNRVDLKGRPTSKNSYTPTWFGKIFSNLQFDIWESVDKPITIFSFKGTDERIDWFTGNLAIGFSVPYKSSKKHVKKYMDKHPGREIILTGHSLGGGIALSVSLWLGKDAYVFDPSPRVFDGLKNANEPAIRKIIYQKGDVLNSIRKYYPKFIKKIPSEDIIRSEFDFQGESNHRGDLLAEGLLKCAVNIKGYVEIAKLIGRKIDCYL